MTVTDVIQFVDRMRVNGVPLRDKLRFLSELDLRIWSMVYGQRGDHPTAYCERDMTDNRALYIADEWCELYRWYLAAMVDLYNGDAELYNNDLIPFNAAWDRFSKWYLREGRRLSHDTNH